MITGLPLLVTGLDGEEGLDFIYTLFFHTYAWHSEKDQIITQYVYNVHFLKNIMFSTLHQIVLKRTVLVLFAIPVNLRHSFYL